MRGRGRSVRSVAVAWSAVLAVLCLVGLAVADLAGHDAGRPAAADDAAAVPQRESGPAPCTGSAALEYTCHADRYHRLVHAAGPAAALADLRSAYVRDGYVRSVCHDLVHAIGHAVGHGTGPAGVLDAYARGGPLCSGGYFHGVTEAAMTARPDEARTVCDDLRARERHSLRHLHCAHGMGHGFLVLQDRDLPAALADCDRLPDAREHRECYGGVFMENVTGARALDQQSTYLRPDDPLHPCPVVDQRYRAACYEKQSAYALVVRGDDVAAVFALCATARGVGARLACSRGLGDRAVVRSTRLVLGDAAQAVAVRDLCRLGPDRPARTACLDGAVRTIVKHGRADSLGVALCAVLSGHDVRRQCAAARARALQEFGRSS